MVLSATINQYAYASLRPRRDSRLTLASLDYDVVAQVRPPAPHALRRQPRPDQGGGARAQGAARRRPVGALRRAARLGARLVLDAGRGADRRAARVARAAARPATRSPSWPTASSASTWGSPAGGRTSTPPPSAASTSSSSTRDSTVVNPLRIRPDVLHELEYRLLLCYMGQTRQSAQHHRAADRGLPRRARRRWSRRCTASRRETLEMKKALLLGDVDAIGELLHEAWEEKKQLDEGISNSHVDQLYQLARREGAIGGKMPGAGGGGYFLLPHALRPQAPGRGGAREARRPGGAVPVRAPRAADLVVGRAPAAPAARARPALSMRIALRRTAAPWRGGLAQYLGAARRGAERARPRCAASPSPASTRASCSRARASSIPTPPRPRFPVESLLDSIGPLTWRAHRRAPRALRARAR